MKSGLWIFIAVWQVLVLMALASGVMVDLFDLFQVPWNSTGWRNFLGTSAGLLLLELPALAALAYALFQKAAKTRA